MQVAQKFELGQKVCEIQTEAQQGHHCQVVRGSVALLCRSWDVLHGHVSHCVGFRVTASWSGFGSKFFHRDASQLYPLINDPQPKPPYEEYSERSAISCPRLFSNRLGWGSVVGKPSDYRTRRAHNTKVADQSDSMISCIHTATLNPKPVTPILPRNYWADIKGGYSLIRGVGLQYCMGFRLTCA